MACIVECRLVEYTKKLVEEIKEQVQEMTKSIFVEWSMKIVVYWPTPVGLLLSAAIDATLDTTIDA